MECSPNTSRRWKCGCPWRRSGLGSYGNGCCSHIFVQLNHLDAHVATVNKHKNALTKSLQSTFAVEEANFVTETAEPTFFEKMKAKGGELLTKTAKITAKGKQLVKNTVSSLTGPKKRINVLAIGATGAGKSTIGNFMVLGTNNKKKHELIAKKKGIPGVNGLPLKVTALKEHISKSKRSTIEAYSFLTKGGEHSCTQYPSTLTSIWPTGNPLQGNVELSFTDLPGLPDTVPANNKRIYNDIVKHIKQQPVSAVLFVFTTEKSTLTNDSMESTALLFSELAEHCGAPFHLVINHKIAIDKVCCTLGICDYTQC